MVHGAVLAITGAVAASVSAGAALIIPSINLHKEAKESTKKKRRKEENPDRLKRLLNTLIYNLTDKGGGLMGWDERERKNEVVEMIEYALYRYYNKPYLLHSMALNGLEKRAQEIDERMNEITQLYGSFK